MFWHRFLKICRDFILVLVVSCTGLLNLVLDSVVCSGIAKMSSTQSPGPDQGQGYVI